MILFHILYPPYFKFRISVVRKRRESRLRKIRKVGNARVAFLVSSLSMWKLQPLYDMLAREEAFTPAIFIYPFHSFAHERKLAEMQKLTEAFQRKGIPFIDLSKEPRPEVPLRAFDPDIIFYPQQYDRLYGNNGLDSSHFDDRLVCFVPYGFNTFKEPWAFNQRLSNYAWRVYYSSACDLALAEEFSYIKGKNVRIVGNPSAETFLSGAITDPWKKTGKHLKRVIWAPHHGIQANSWLKRASFFQLHDRFLELAGHFESEIQFAFKPHPRLIVELYKHPDWGKERTDEYFRRWESLPNTQLETGEYTDLLLTSDALVHDCGSFTAEYLYCHKPCFFFTGNREETTKDLSEMGRAAFEAHYTGADGDSIARFLKDVVLDGTDPLAPQREAVYQQYLLPPDGRSAAENIFKDLSDSIFKTNQ